MSGLVALKTTGLLARKGEAAPAMVKATFTDPALAWGGEREHAPMTWENTPAAGLTPHPAVPHPVARHPVARRPKVVELAVAPAPVPAAKAKARGARHAFTARLPMALYRRLKEESARTGRPMTHLVAEALGKVLTEA
ncbi:MAG: hypothetical protein WCZ23_06325 [Rhodospirillaceae bacterium]